MAPVPSTPPVTSLSLLQLALVTELRPEWMRMPSRVHARERETDGCSDEHLATVCRVLIGHRMILPSGASLTGGRAQRARMDAAELLQVPSTQAWLVRRRSDLATAFPQTARKRKSNKPAAAAAASPPAEPRTPPTEPVAPPPVEPVAPPVLAREEAGPLPRLLPGSSGSSRRGPFRHGRLAAARSCLFMQDDARNGAHDGVS